MSTETTNKKIKIDNGTTFGRTYTDKAVDAKLPTDLIASANKLSLGVGNAPLGSGVNLSGFTYDEATKTLKAEGSGATLPAGTKDDPFVLNTKYKVFIDNQSGNPLRVETPTRIFFVNIGAENDKFTNFLIYLRGQNFSGSQSTYKVIKTDGTGNTTYILQSDDHAGTYKYFGYDIKEQSLNVLIADTTKSYHKGKYISVPTDKTESYYLNATYDATSGKSDIKWSYLKKTYNHYIVISDGTASNAIYMLIPSANSLICSSLPELNTLLGNTNRFIQASGVVTDATSKLPIVAINWQGSFSSSKIVTMSSEEATTKFTDISDIVEPA